MKHSIFIENKNKEDEEVFFIQNNKPFHKMMLSNFSIKSKNKIYIRANVISSLIKEMILKDKQIKSLSEKQKNDIIDMMVKAYDALDFGHTIYYKKMEK